MTSFKLSPNTKEALCKEARRLFELRVADKERDVPLTPDQVVTATTPIVARKCFDILAGMGAEINKTQVIYAIVHSENEITRPALLEICLADNVPYVWNAQALGTAASYYTEKAFNSNLATLDVSKLPFDMNTLDVSTRVKFTKWFNEAVYERRLCDAAYKIVSTFIRNHCTSTGELYRRWPGMRVLFNNLGAGQAARMRAVTTDRNGPSRWGWPGTGEAWDWYVENVNKMQGVEILLVEASSIIDSEAKRQSGGYNPYRQKPPPIRASISRVQKNV